jgi:Leucine-rich repeat (LRR) protein
MKKTYIILLILVTSYYSKSQVLEQDSLALVAIYNSTNGDNWTYNNYWLSYPVELWFGIEVSYNRVVKIDLNYNNLSGYIPEEIGDLDSLSYFSIYNNSIDSISSSTGDCTILDTLMIFSNPIDFLPPEIGDLSNLRYFNFGNTEITYLPEELGGLTSLEYLLGINGILQNIPESLGNMTSLKEIDLSLNNISNLPSSVGNCTNLTRLQVNANEIPSVPTEIGNLSNLEILILGANNISELPEEIFTLTNLWKLNFAANDLNYISPSIGNLVNLENFQFFNNEFTTIPEEIGNLTNLTYINGYSNRLSSLPLTLLNLPNVQTLYVVYNQLTFEDIEPLISITGFEYWGQDSIGFSVDTTVYLNTAYTMEIQTGGEFNKYQWLKNGDTIVGANNYFLEFQSLNYADSGEYHCLVTNTIATGLTLYSRVVNLHIIDPLNIKEDGKERDLSFYVYPNPAHDKVFIRFAEKNIYEYISFYNQYGVYVKSYKTKDSYLFEIDISELNKGIYFIQLFYDNNQTINKIEKLIVL